MSGRFNGAELNLRYDDGTVGAFLQKGGTVGLSLHNLWQFSLLISVVLGAIATVFAAYGQKMDAALNDIAGIDLSTAQIMPWIIASCVVSVLLSAALVVVSFRLRGKRRDRRRQLRSQVISIMAKNPRFPVGMQTPLGSLGLRCLYLKGDRAIELTSRYPFVAEDFAQGSMSSQAVAHSLFNAYDFEVFKGKLFVYYDESVSEELREKRYRKVAGRYA